MHHLTGAASAGLHGHADFSRAPRPGRSQQSKCHRASGPSRALLAFSSGLYTGLSFALGHSSKSKEGCVGDRLSLPRPARRGRPSPARPASELGQSRGPPGARHPRRPLVPSPPALLPRDSRRRTIARIVLVNAKEVVPPANRARPPGAEPSRACGTHGTARRHFLKHVGVSGPRASGEDPG